MFRSLLFGLTAAFVLLLSSGFHGQTQAQDFQAKDWEVSLPGPGAGVQHLGEGVALLFRPHLVSKSDWLGGSLSFTWEPPKLPEKADDGHIYGDHLIVFLSSDGTFRETRSYEVKTGLVVRLNSVNGNIALEKAIDGENFEVLKMVKGTGPIQGAHAIVITDKDGTITVSVDGAEVLSVAVPETARKGKRWGFYNREPVANARNISKVMKIAYKP